MEKVFLQNC